MNGPPPNLDAYLAQPSPVQPFLGRLLAGRPAPVILDIGACEGEDSIRYSRLYPSARIFAFEPLPSNQALIRANFAAYGVANAQLVPLALCERAGTAVFHVSAGRPADLFSGEHWNYGNKSSSLLAPAESAPMHGWITFPETIPVACETLDRFCAAQALAGADFVHLDVQGAEGRVLDGAAALLPRLRALWLEVASRELYQGQPLREQIQARMRAAGFALAHEHSRGLEGDQLYLNRRFARNRYCLARWRAARLARALAARARPAARPPPPP
jgi:FkbM family methyltransferase